LHIVDEKTTFLSVPKGCRCMRVTDAAAGRASTMKLA
jgi:hypothetical protein